MDYIKKVFTLILIYLVFVASEQSKNFKDKKVPDLITEEGYTAESHYVTTKDGYNLCLHRIPVGKNGESNKKVAFLQHGFLTSSSDWILFGSRNSLGYILADEGYDVWMGNVRGNIYSRNHTSYNPDRDEDFWKFSWHEIGKMDLPTMIDYVLNVTGVDGLHYVGHSQGTTSFYVMASQNPDYNDKIKVQSSLSPIAYMSHMTSPLLKIISNWEGPLEDLLGAHEFLPGTGFLHMLTEEICSIGLGPILCENALFAICGFSISETDTSRMPIIAEYAPAGSSTRQILHYTQEISSGKFRQYDFGLLKNWIVYDQAVPPDYDLSKITAPVYLFYSKNDWLAGLEDVERLSKEIGNLKGEYLVIEDTFNHLDFVYGVNAHILVYRHIVNIFSDY